MTTQTSERAGHRGLRPVALWPDSKSVDDMRDALHETPTSPRLQAAIVECHTVLFEAFDRHDRQALGQQRWHGWIVRIAAGLGTLAVLAAIAELGTTIELVPRLEVTAAVLALVEV